MTGAPDVVLGVDLGSTATKVVAVDRAFRLVGTVERASGMRTASDGEAVHDPESVLAGAIDALRESVQACAAGGYRVRGLSFSAALHTLLALDAAGEPLTPALSWADSRSTRTARRIRAAHGAELHRATGTPVHPMSPLAKLAWFEEEEPTLLREAATWCGLKDFVVSRFTGRRVTDLSCASATGLLDMAGTAWHPLALATAGVSPHQLPDLVAPTAVLSLGAEIAGLVGLPAGLPVAAGAGDGPLANLAVGAVRPGTAALSVGTSGALRVIRDRPGVDDGCRVFCYYLADGLWVLGGAVSNAGVVAQWAAETFGDVPIEQLLAEAARIEPGAEGLIALPHLLAERAPWWNPDTRGALIGLRRGHGRAAITRAMVEGVGQQLALVRDSVLAAGAQVTTVRATGGALRSPLWEQVLAAALGTPLEVIDDSAGSGFGAALLVWRALGELDSLTTGSWAEPRRVVHPDATATERMAATRHLTEQLYGALRGLG